MDPIETGRLRLALLSVAEAQRIIGGEASDDRRWAADYPFEGDVIGARAFVHTAGAFGEHPPFGAYQIVRRGDGCAIGGIGFRGAPENGAVAVGYGLVPSARGRGYAFEALWALMSIARDHGATRLLADTAPDNVASIRTLGRAGFTQLADTDELLHYAVALAEVDFARRRPC